MKGESNTVELMDCNHLFKVTRSQIVLGGSIKTFREVILDAGLLLLIDIPTDVVIIADFASDAKLIRLCSRTTIEKLLLLEHDNEDEVGVLGLTLFFLQLFINACNLDTM